MRKVPYFVEGHRQGTAGCSKCQCDRCRRAFGERRAQDFEVRREANSAGSDEDLTSPFLDASPGADLEAEDIDELDLRGDDEGERQRRRRGITQVDIQPTEARPPHVSFDINFTLTIADVFPEMEALPLGVRPCVCEASQPPS